MSRRPPVDGVSVVVPTAGRSPHLDRWIAALASWAPYPWPVEVIIADAGGVDRAAAIVDTWRRRGLDVKVVRVREGGRPRNTGAARNVGIRVARHDLILNSDPDAVFVTDVIRLLVGSWQPGAFCTVSGCYPLTMHATERLVAHANEQPLTATDLLDAARGRQNLAQLPDGAFALHAGFLCDRAALVDLRGYDERFVEEGWEDCDVASRLESAGWQRRFVSGAAVVRLWHPSQRPHVSGTSDQVLYEIGWQRACALAHDATTRNVLGWGGRTDPAPQRQPPRDEAEHRAGAWCHAVEAHVAAGDCTRALACLGRALAESGASPQTASVADRLRELAHAQHAWAAPLAIAYARIAHALGQHDAADAALEVAMSSSASRDAAVSLRAWWLADLGHASHAIALLRARLASVASATCLARLLELELARGHDDDAAAALAAWRPAISGAHVLDSLLLDCYAHRLGVDRSPEAWPPRVAGEWPGDFLFSAAMRALRDGLLFGATTACAGYVALPVGTDPALSARAEELADVAEPSAP